MSLYYVQKLLYNLNRDPDVAERFKTSAQAVLAHYDLSDEELAAVQTQDFGLLYVMGVNGQLLMHFAALCGVPWERYLRALED
ncbi:MAG: aromatic ring-opening dioxygenase subunit LigA, partial [Steroidobacteraceae bacterium]